MYKYVLYQQTESDFTSKSRFYKYGHQLAPLWV